jgi:AraC-like DNA-binding protein
MHTDAFSEVLRAVRLTGAIFFRLDARGSWVVETPPAAICAPFVMPQAQHVLEYHIITDGSCWGGPIDTVPVRLEAGDIIAFPQGDPHVLSSAPGLRQQPDMAFYQDARASQLPLSITLGEPGPPTTRIICGFLGCDARPFNPLLGALPRMLHLRAGDGRDGAWLNHLIEAAVAESAKRRMGSDCILARLSELMFIELVRRHLEAVPVEETGWFAGLRDVHVGRALNLLHGGAATPWTLERLARDAGLSRSSLAERFVRLVGYPPMQYLAQWRMQLAAGLLTNSSQQVAQIAVEVGYDSEAAFSRAFHKLVGMPPAVWRRTRDHAMVADMHRKESMINERLAPPPPSQKEVMPRDA